MSTSFTESVDYWLRDFWLQHADRRVAKCWIARNGIVPTVSIVLIYLALTLVIIPKWMANRAPLSLRLPMILYNVTMSLANLCFAAWAFVLWRFGLEWFNFVAPSQYDTSPTQMKTIYFMHIYLLSKFVDLLDTFFVVLRKKQSQLTFLHLYHHSIVPVIATMSFIIHPTSIPVGIFAFFNSIVHSLVYAYLGLVTLGPSMAKYVWWKKYITQLEIIQFFIFIIFTALFSLYSRGYSMAYMWIGISQNPLFAFLFIRFYFKSYQSTTDIEKVE